MEKKHVYIIGSKGIPANYGGFETFVEKLTENKQSNEIQYHIACMGKDKGKIKHYTYNGAECFDIPVPNIGASKAIFYDLRAINYSIELARKNKDIKPIFIILACRIGPFIKKIKEKIHKINGKLIVNPDGHEWLRSKWSYPVKKYWKLSERLMVKYSDLIVCDSKNIQKYVNNNYKKYSPHTTYISYGSDIRKSNLSKESELVRNWYEEQEVTENNYYLIVGRFVPENNYETMITEYLKSNTKRDLVIVTDVQENKFLKKLRILTQFNNDSRIKFVGTVYNQELLKYIRQNAFAYVHGHEVGGTNPSLLEGLSFTKNNLLLNVSFNSEVAKDEAYYWDKSEGDLSHLINYLEKTLPTTKEPQKIIIDGYNWDDIVFKYEQQIMKI